MRSIRHIAVAPLFGWAFGVCKAIFSGMAMAFAVRDAQRLTSFCFVALDDD